MTDKDLDLLPNYCALLACIISIKPLTCRKALSYMGLAENETEENGEIDKLLKQFKVPDFKTGPGKKVTPFIMQHLIEYYEAGYDTLTIAKATGLQKVTVDRNLNKLRKKVI